MSQHTLWEVFRVVDREDAKCLVEFADYYGCTGREVRAGAVALQGGWL